MSGRGDLDLLEGEGRCVTGRRFQLGDTLIEADRIFLNTGTRDTVPAVEGLDGVDYLTLRSTLDLRQIPAHLEAASHAVT